MKLPRKNRSLSASQSDESMSTPMLEIFAGALAIMMVLFVIMNITGSSLSTQQAGETDEKEYKISWETGTEGYVIVAYPSKLWIIEKQQTVSREDICKPGKGFIEYAQEKYSAENRQIIFAVLDNGVRTTFLARNCLQQMYPSTPVSIGWIMANEEFLKTLHLQDIPAYVGAFNS